MQFTILRHAENTQLEQAAAFNHTELFCMNALSVGGKVFRSDDVVWTHAGNSIESMIAFPQLTKKEAGDKLDEIMQYYLNHPPRGVGCWSLDPPQTKDLGPRLLARGFQPGWQPNWMSLNLEELQLDHQAPEGLQVEHDNTSSLENIQNLPYGETDSRIFSNQPLESTAGLHRLIAKLNGNIVAHCSVLLTSGSLGAGGIYHVGVLPPFRKQGIGKAVVGEACRFAKNRGYHYVLLNGTGRRMYEQLGFKKLGNGLTWWLVTSRLMAHPPTKKEIALAEAIGMGDGKVLENIGSGADDPDLEAPLTNGMTLMQLAVHCRQTASVEWLLSKGVSVRIMEAWDLGWKELAASILTEHPEYVNQLYGDSQATMLHISAERGDQQLARLALSAKPNIGIKDKTYHSTPLQWATHLQKENIARLITSYQESLIR